MTRLDQACAKRVLRDVTVNFAMRVMWVRTGKEETNFLLYSVNTAQLDGTKKKADDSSAIPVNPARINIKKINHSVNHV